MPPDSSPPLREADRPTIDKRTQRVKCLAQCACILGDGDPAGLVSTWLSESCAKGRPSAHRAVGAAVKERLAPLYEGVKAQNDQHVFARDVLTALGDVCKEVDGLQETPAGSEQNVEDAATKQLLRRVLTSVCTKLSLSHDTSATGEREECVQTMNHASIVDKTLL